MDTQVGRDGHTRASMQLKLARGIARKITEKI